MRTSRLLSILSLVVITTVLTACGTDDSPEATTVPTVTQETVTEIATGTPETALAAATAARVERPTVAAATPLLLSATPMATVSAATPLLQSATPISTVSAATPVTMAAPDTMPVQATIVLNGAEQSDYLITADGCVGIGAWSQLQPGAQVIVRDASGTVVDVAELEASDTSGDCSWVADISVPESEFVSISVPMVAEVWFSQSDLESGMVEITLP